MLFFINSILIGAALAMDAFSVSVAAAISGQTAKRSRGLKMVITFALFQTFMPLIGWAFVDVIKGKFSVFEKWLPVITLVILGAIGINMIIKAFSPDKSEDNDFNDIGPLKIAALGAATSIDALSAGFAMAEYRGLEAVVEALIIGVVTFIICYIGMLIGKKIGTRLADRAGAVGGAVLFVIGLEIFIRSVVH